MIHESAYVEKGATLGENTKVWHFAQIRKQATIGKNCVIGKDVFVDYEVSIGDNCKVQNFASIYHGVRIEDDVFIGPHVCFTNDIHPRASLWDESRLCKTLVKQGASVGANATIIAGVTIGRFALVGAGAVVTEDVPDYGLVYGNPACLRGFVCECGETLTKGTCVDDCMRYHCSSCKREISISKMIAEKVQ